MQEKEAISLLIDVMDSFTKPLYLRNLIAITYVPPAKETTDTAFLEKYIADLEKEELKDEWAMTD